MCTLLQERALDFVASDWLERRATRLERCVRACHRGADEERERDAFRIIDIYDGSFRRHSGLSRLSLVMPPSITLSRRCPRRPHPFLVVLPSLLSTTISPSSCSKLPKVRSPRCSAQPEQLR